MFKPLHQSLTGLFKWFGIDIEDANRAIHKRRRQTRTDRLWLFWDRSKSGQRYRPRLTPARISAWRKAWIDEAARQTAEMAWCVKHARMVLGRKNIRPADLRRFTAHLDAA